MEAITGMVRTLWRKIIRRRDSVIRGHPGARGIKQRQRLQATICKRIAGVWIAAL